MYNLTETQKEVLKWIVAYQDEVNAGDGFEVQMHGDEFDLIVTGRDNVSGEKSTFAARLPNATFSSLTALAAAKCLEVVPSVIPPYYGRRSFTLTGHGRKGVETDFAEPSAASPTQAFTFNTTVHGGSNFQIGNQNQMELQNALQSIVRVIDSAAASPAEKVLAKGILAQAFENSAVATVLGELASIAVQTLTK